VWYSISACKKQPVKTSLHGALLVHLDPRLLGLLAEARPNENLKIYSSQISAAL
jgi:hypothetical protein